MQTYKIRLLNGSHIDLENSMLTPGLQLSKKLGIVPAARPPYKDLAEAMSQRVPSVPLQLTPFLPLKKILTRDWAGVNRVTPAWEISEKLDA